MLAFYKLSETKKESLQVLNFHDLLIKFSILLVEISFKRAWM